MNWCEVSAAVPVEQAEAAAEAMRTVVPAGVQIDDPLVPLGPEEGVRLDRRRPSIVRVYLPVDDTLGEQVGRIDRALAGIGLHPELSTRTVREEDWAHAWKEHFHVERIGERIVIRPSWRDYDPQSGDVVIELDPGMAFGTGQHPTTRMCLALLEREARPGMVVLDVGCGSGILSVAAVRLGAGKVLALDIEPQAVQVARENADRNGVADAIRVELGSLGEGWRQADAPPRDADLVVANITAGAVAGLAPAFASSLRAGGVLIGSGIIGERLDDVCAALESAGFTMGDVWDDGDWRALVARLA